MSESTRQHGGDTADTRRSDRGTGADDARRSDRAADAALVDRILAGDRAAFELLMRRHNQLLFRAARSVVGSSEAEDVVQQAWLKAWRALPGFEKRSSLATWLVRIAIHEALTRAKRSQRVVRLASAGGGDADAVDDESLRASGWLGERRRRPEEAAGDGELRSVLIEAIDRLPESLRTVFMLRAVEECSVEETGACLGISPEAVRVRLHRARSLLRDEIDRRISEESRRLFSFGHERCDRVVAAVLAALAAELR